MNIENTDIKSHKCEVYIPIEIKPREFVSHILLAGELSKLGLRVYLGSKKSIDFLIDKKNKNIVFNLIYKSSAAIC